MTNRVFAAALSALAISSVLCEASPAATHHHARVTPSRAHKTTPAHNHNGTVHHYRSAALIPPPPAYMPSLLPEMYYHGTGSGITEIASEEKKENPYAQYVKSPTGDAPEAMASRKGVVTWSQKRY